MRAGEVDTCRDVLLPIWERWTGGSSALRRFLEYEGPDPDGNADRLHALIDTAGKLRAEINTMRRRHDSPGIQAAILAAAACLKAHAGAPEWVWREVAGWLIVGAWDDLRAARGQWGAGKDRPGSRLGSPRVHAQPRA